MKKTLLVEIGIIATALILGYNMIISLFTLLSTLVIMLETDIAQSLGLAILPAILVFAFYAISFFVLVRYARPLSGFICRQTDDTIDIRLKKASILQIVIIAVCFLTLLRTMPNVIEYLVNKATRGNEEFLDNTRTYRSNASFVNSLISLVISTILLITSKNIASFFGKEEQSFEIAGEKIEKQ